MKRYIRSSVDVLEFTYPDGSRERLPEWFRDKTPEEIEDAKQQLIDDFGNHPTYYDDDEYEPAISEGELVKLKQELRKEGFTKAEIDEIEYRVTSGWTVDAAIQEVEEK